jgi:sulfate adenylyltransferase
VIKPHGSHELNPLYVDSGELRQKLVAEATGLPAITVSSATAANAVMLGAGYFNPLLSFQDRTDALSVATSLRTVDGLFWPVPVLNLVADAAAVAIGDRIALRDPNVEGAPVLALQTVENIETLTSTDLNALAENVFGTLDLNHPGVAAFMAQGSVLLSGPIEVLNYSYFATEFPDTFRTAPEIRNEITQRGWQRVVAFQTRNPMHRAHEELCKMAQQAVDADGVLVHMLLGKLKAGDIPAAVRDAAIRKMVDVYFPENTVMVTGYGFDMLYAGPREAILHAVFRQNAGCTHFIVGRDHAGVGDYYGPFEAQQIFRDKVGDNDLEIEIFEADHTAYSRKLDRVVMMRDAPDHTADDFVLLSGTKVRDMLAAGQALPPEFARPEVAEILMQYYQQASA